MTETSHGVSIYNSEKNDQSCYIPKRNGECSTDKIVCAYCDVLKIRLSVYDWGTSCSLLRETGRQKMIAEVGNCLCLLRTDGEMLHEVKCDDLFLRSVSDLFNEISDAERILGRRPMTELQSLKLKRFLVNMFSTASRKISSFCSPFWGSVNLERINVVDTLDSPDLYRIWPVSQTAQDAINDSLLRRISIVVDNFGLTTENCVIAVTNYYLRNAFLRALDLND